MLVSICIAVFTFIAMIICVLFAKPFKIGKIKLDAYWLVALLGAVAMLIFNQVDFSAVISELLSDTAINPVKILILFISMTVLSVFLDELGFFRYLATVTLNRAHASQKKLFLYLYLIVSVLTVFTSNDVIILSFTPFICYFAKNAEINPVPYLSAEFIAANTWSMALVIGNPTNIYLATAMGIDFIEYITVMLLPTVASGLVAFAVLVLIFNKQLNVPLHESHVIEPIKDKTLFLVGVSHLSVCTIMLAIGSYIGVEMWLVALISALSLFIWVTVISFIRHKKPTMLVNSIKGAPWQLIPFVLSMFVIVIALNKNGVTAEIAYSLSGYNEVIGYGLSSFLASNFINNIPMSVLFSSVIAEGAAGIGAVFATIIGSNIGAFLTPVGALAGIMFNSLTKSHDVEFTYGDFIKIGAEVSIPTLLTALFTLMIVI